MSMSSKVAIKHEIIYEFTKSDAAAVITCIQDISDYDDDIILYCNPADFNTPCFDSMRIELDRDGVDEFIMDNPDSRSIEVAKELFELSDPSNDYIVVSIS